jgi:ABC-type bacteriocin/lantibiotic exporter with double-glycine peptidase domain
MSTLVAFDEINYRLQTFADSPFSEHYEVNPIARGIAYSLVAMGWEGTPAMLADVFEVSAREPLSFEQTITRLGYVCETLEQEDLHSLAMLECPCLVSFESFSGILLKLEAGIASFYDYRNDAIVERPFPKKGTKVITVSSYSKLFREPPPASQDRSNWIKYCFYRYSSEMKSLTWLSFFISMLGAINPFFIMAIYTFALTSGSTETLIWLTAGAIITAAMEYKFKQYRMTILDESGKELAIYISYHVTSKLLWLPYAMTSSAGVSSQLARLKDIDQFRRLVTSDSTLSYFDFPFIFIFMIAIMMLSGLAAITVVVGIIAMLLFCIVSRNIYERVTSQNSRANALVSYQWNEILSHLGSVQGLPILKVIQSRFRTAQAQSLNDSEAVSLTNDKIQQFGQGFIQVIGTTSIVVAVVTVVEGLADPSAMIVIIILVWKALSPIMGIYNSLTRFKSIQNSTKQINALMALKDDREHLEKSPPIEYLNGNLKIAGLTHRYPGNPTGLTNLEFEIKAGDKVTVVGPPGCGKTTLLNILSGLETNYQGSVFSESYNVRQFNSFRYRNSVKHVPFNAHFFDTSLRENFYLYNGQIRQADMLAMINHFELEPYLTNGLDTRLSKEFIASIPNGGQQLLRLAIALGDARQGLIIIDEPLLGCSKQYANLLTSLNNGILEEKTVIISTNEKSLVASFNSCLLLDADGGQKYYGAADKVIGTL